VKTRDDEALDEARSTTSSNRAAIGNLHESLKEVLSMIRISGVARKGEPSSSTSSKKSSKKSSPKSASSTSKTKKKETASFEELSSMKTGYEVDVAAADAIDTNALQNELDGLDFGDDSDESDMDDDDIDLR
jgi:hypothetical protein